MAVCDKEVIDIVARDGFTNEVLLVMVEDRPWGTRGELLPELEDKFNLYYSYATDGQLIRDYPDLGDLPIHIQLRSLETPGQREREFLSLVVRLHLEPAGIKFSALSIETTSPN